jgi:hypothetical protein
MKVWVMMGQMGLTGYKIGPAVFDYPVTREEIDAELAKRFPRDYEYLSFDIWEEEVNTR